MYTHCIDREFIVNYLYKLAGYSTTGLKKQLLPVLFIALCTSLVSAQNCNVDFPGAANINFSDGCGVATVDNLTLGESVFMGDNDTFTFDSPATITVNGNFVIKAMGEAKVIIPVGVTVDVKGNIQFNPEAGMCVSSNGCTFELVVNGTLLGDDNLQNNINKLIWSGTGEVDVDGELGNSSSGCMECSPTTCPAFPSGDGCKDNAGSCPGGSFCVNGNYGNDSPIGSDGTPPVISNCVGNQEVGLPDGSCEITVNWTPPDVTDNVSVSTFTSNHSPGDNFSIGTTVVTYTATDAAGNVASCDFEVIVVDDIPPEITACPENIDGNIGSNCDLAIDWVVPTATDNCELGSFTSNFNPGDSFPIGNTTVVYTAIDQAGNETICSFDVIIGDNILPEFDNCPTAPTISDYDLTLGTAIVTWPMPTATDNCERVTLTSSHQSGDAFANGITTVAYSATDEAGNVATCSFEVEVNGNNIPVVQPIIVQATESQPIEICLEATDPDGDLVSIAAVNYNSSNGNISQVDADALCFTYTSVAGFEGLESFQVVICDDQDPKACAEASVQIEVTIDKEIIIYKAFTPDNDNINDTWEIGNIEFYPENQVKIFDRWGGMVFSARGYNNEGVVWDGSTNQRGRSGGKAIPSGTYFYTIDLGIGKSVKKGFVELIQ